jgi:Protein of unknown function (DUF3074)
VISKPCVHPDAPPREGYIRGHYESIEFIREVPKAKTNGPVGRKRASSSALGKEAMLRNAGKSASFPLLPNVEESTSGATPATHPDGMTQSETAADSGRARGKTISFGERGREGIQDEDEDESNPVEWIMITRSDPGGSVPRWMVERGTPAGIVGDAVKFIDWALEKEHPEEDEDDEEEEEDSEKDEEAASATDVQATNADGKEVIPTIGDIIAPTTSTVDITSNIESTDKEAAPASTGEEKSEKSTGYIAGAVGAVGTGAAIAATFVSGRLTGQSNGTAEREVAPTNGSTTSSDEDDDSDDGSSLRTFKTADEGSDAESTPSPSQTTSRQNTLSPSKSTAEKTAETDAEKALAKLNADKAKADEKLRKAREKDQKDTEDMNAAETARLAKIEEKHAREIAKREEKYQKELAKIEAKKKRDAQKADERRKKQMDKDEVAKLTRERDEARQELEKLQKERAIFELQVGQLQAENTALVARLGRLDVPGGGSTGVQELKKEVSGRSRAFSLGRKDGDKRSSLIRNSSFLGGSLSAGSSMSSLPVNGKENSPAPSGLSEVSGASNDSTVTNGSG